MARDDVVLAEVISALGVAVEGVAAETDRLVELSDGELARTVISAVKLLVLCDAVASVVEGAFISRLDGDGRG